MLFTSPVFLFLFLPLVLGAHSVVGRRLRNGLLLAASLLFYAWGEGAFVLGLCGSIAANYLFGRALDAPRRRTGVLAVAVATNLALLGVFKYAAFLVDNLNAAAAVLGVAPLHLAPVHLPIGISFFTFHALSYLIDVSRRRVRAQRSPIDFGLYITLFPQLIAGPIVRYHDIAAQLAGRTVRRERFAAGVRRFVLGLGKKTLIADTLALPADAIFALPPASLTASLAWAGALLYTLQIYCDFSAYSDMAIGLARMLGFEFLENFDYPYVSRSVTEFWRRWHISLSRWFRDYLYIALGGNRRGTLRTSLNLVTVFFLCGLWHGASWTFVVWGLFHGAFLVLERAGLGSRLARLSAPLRHAYTLAVVVVGWVLFRAPTLAVAGAFLAAMAGFGHGSGLEYRLDLYGGPDVALAVVAGVLASTPLVPLLARRVADAVGRLRPGRAAVGLEVAAAAAEVAALAAVFVASGAAVAASTYNPFIYFRF